MGVQAPDQHGKELARATATLQQTSIGGTDVDITGLTITFTVGIYPVMVEAFCPWIVGTVTDDGASVEIRDGSSVNTAVGGVTVANSGSGRHEQGRAVEFITTPGTYTRKVSLIRNGGTGTLSNGAALSTLVSWIRAIQY